MRSPSACNWVWLASSAAALAAFFAVLERYTLADVLDDKGKRLLATLGS